MATPEIYDIYPMRYVPFWHKGWFLVGSVVLGGLLLIGIGVLLVIAVRRYRLSCVSCEQRAHMALQNDELYEALRNRRSIIFYSKLIAILKQYSAHRYKVYLESCTDNELLEKLAVTSMPAEQLVLFKNILTHATQARFANAVVVNDQMIVDHEYAIIIVNETTRAAKSPTSVSS
jgi:hypothetical protein